MRSRILPLVTFSFCLSQAHANNCKQALVRILDDTRPMEKVAPLLKKSESVLGKKLTAQEEKALAEVVGRSPVEAYTAADVVRENQALLQAGFKDAQINELRRRGVLGNSVISTANGAPTGVVTQAMALKEIDRAAIMAMRRDGDSLRYVLAEDGRIFVTRDKFDLPADKIVLATHQGKGVVVREAGEIGFDKAQGSFSFKPKYGLDTGEMEARMMIDRVTAIHPGSTIKYVAPANMPHSRVVKCLDILSGQSKGRNFILDRMITENIITVGAIGVGEAMGAGRMKTEEGRRVVMGDLIGGNVNNLWGSAVAKNLVLKDANLTTSMMVRTGMGFSMIEVQKGIHNVVVPEQKAADPASEIANFNRAHFLARLPINHYFDKFTVNSLPQMIFGACQRNSSMSVMFSPRAVRLYERFGSATIYYGLRQQIVGQ